MKICFYHLVDNMTDDQKVGHSNFPLLQFNKNQKQKSPQIHTFPLHWVIYVF